MSKNSQKEANTESEEKKEIGVFLKFKTSNKSTAGIFDYSSDKSENCNAFINEKKYIYKSKNKTINLLNDQGSAGNEDELLFLIRRTTKEVIYIDNSVLNFQSLEKLRNEKNYLWYVIKSENEKIINPNEDYYLTEGDIIKLGYVKYLVKKICINESGNEKTSQEEKNPDETEVEQKKKEEKKEIEQIKIEKEKKKKEEFEKKRIESCQKNQDERNKNSIFECKEWKKCDFCNEKLFHLCKCKDYQHFNSIKSWMENRKIIINNKKETVTNYYLEIFFCNECIGKDQAPYCIESECKCEKCNTYYPLKFKYLNEEGIMEEKDCYPIYIPENTTEKIDYMILESLEYRDEFKNSPKVIKAIHVITLTGEDINIGRDDKNDVIVNHSSVSKKHAVIKNINGKLLLKNRSEKSGTLVLIQNKFFDFSEKEVFLQVNKTFISAKIMKKKDFLSKEQNSETIYPKINDGKNTEENSKINSNDKNLNQQEENKSNNTKKSKAIFEEIQNNNNIPEEPPQPSYGNRFYNNINDNYYNFYN